MRPQDVSRSTRLYERSFPIRYESLTTGKTQYSLISSLSALRILLRSFTKGTQDRKISLPRGLKKHQAKSQINMPSGR